LRNLKPAVIVFILLALPDAFSQQKQRFVLLPESEARRFTNPSMNLCSRETPRAEGTWQPSEADLKSLEAHFSDLSKLVSKGSPSTVQILHPEQYYRQYIGVVVRGKKLIYINSLPDITFSRNWREEFVDVCDGGARFWGAFYDTATGQFSNLQTNGPK
jgi:hypothetical protein